MIVLTVSVQINKSSNVYTPLKLEPVKEFTQLPCADMCYNNNDLKRC